jgi:hypothetical protein
MACGRIGQIRAFFNILPGPPSGRSAARIFPPRQAANQKKSEARLSAESRGEA